MYDYLNRVEDGLTMRSAGLWAAEKLDYLQRYIAVFEKSMHTHWPVRNYIDLMAGPGKNCVRRTGEVLLGSPLLALTTEFPFTGYYFTDLNPENTSALEARCKTTPSYQNVHIHTGDCNILVNQVVQALKPSEHKSLNLAFLDPEGLELRWNTVANLASIRKMDLIINYPQGGLNRMMIKVYQSPDDNAVDLFFGTHEWRKIYTKYVINRRIPLHRELIDLYKSQLHTLGYQEIKRGDEVGGYEPLMRNTKRNVPLYRLIFASKHPLAEKFWHEITKRNIYGQKRMFDAG